MVVLVAVTARRMCVTVVVVPVLLLPCVVFVLCVLSQDARRKRHCLYAP